MFGGAKENTQKLQDAFETIIGNACKITGDISSKSAIRVDGHIEGNVSSDGTIAVTEKGFISGDVQSNELKVYGKVEGRIDTQKLHLYPTAKILGDINTQDLHIESGADYEGAVSMKKKTLDNNVLKQSPKE